MLRFLLYSKAEAEIRYAATEFMSLLGLPFEEIEDLSQLDRNGSAVLVIPESAEMSPEQENDIFTSSLSVISLGYLPQERICRELGFEVIERRFCEPPQSSGMLQTIDGLSSLFFYDFPLVKTVERSTSLIGKIETGGNEFPGIIASDMGGSLKVFVFPSLLRSIAYLFSGGEESLSEIEGNSLQLFDENRRIIPEKVKLYRGRFIYLPIIAIYREVFLDILKEISKKNGIPIVQKWYHPHGSNITLCLTHDIDVVAGISFLVTLRHLFEDFKVKKFLSQTFLGFLHKISTSMFDTHISNVRDPFNLIPQWMASKLIRYDPFWNFGEYRKIEEKFKAEYPSYFFQVGLTREAFEGLHRSIEIDYTLDCPIIRRTITSLKEGGAEIGLHGSIVSYNCIDNLKKEKKKLANLIGNPDGIRQHRQLLSYPETWEYQAEAGFKYDTSFGYVHDVGFKAGTGMPFHPWNFHLKKKIPILEVPLIIVDGTLFQEHLLNYSEEQALKVCRELVDTTNKYSSVLTLLWHPHHNMGTQGYWLSAYRKLLSYASEYRPWYTGAGELVKWWTLRNEVTFGAAENSKARLSFSVRSPRSFEGFSMRIWFPSGPAVSQVFVNGQALSEEDIQKDGDFLLFKFKISDGNNKIVVNH